VLELGLAHTHTEGWATSATDLEGLGEPLHRATGDGSEAWLLELEGALVQIGLTHGHVYAAVAAAERGPVDAAVARLRERLPAPDPSSAHEVTVTFWTYGPQGPMPTWRSIAVPSWDDIAANYPASTRGGLEALMRGFKPAHGGQLVLWHGQAGTGKTFGLRALAWEWRDWCHLHYIVDPDSFFGQHADYLMSVLMQPGYIPFTTASRHGFIPSGDLFSVTAVTGEEEDDDADGLAKAWRVLVLEDTGELLSADARVSLGQGLSRFLNVVDGLIGQGLRVLVLVTTNEPIRRLHPAVARPGRCAANVEFVPLSAEEARDWLTAHDVAEPSAAAATIAQLYARVHGLESGELPPLVGFGES
jgi:ATPase family protein associated with various cellular activities (AAA)